MNPSFFVNQEPTNNDKDSSNYFEKQGPSFFEKGEDACHTIIKMDRHWNTYQINPKIAKLDEELEQGIRRYGLHAEQVLHQLENQS